MARKPPPPKKTVADLLDSKLADLTLREIIAVIDAYIDFRETGHWNWKELCRQDEEDESKG